MPLPHATGEMQLQMWSDIRFCEGRIAPRREGEGGLSWLEFRCNPALGRLVPCSARGVRSLASLLMHCTLTSLKMGVATPPADPIALRCSWPTGDVLTLLTCLPNLDG